MTTSNTSLRLMLALMGASLILTLLPQIAWAAGDDSWVQPGTSLMENLESGLVTLGAVVVGIGVIGVGIWACASGHLRWERLGYVVLGGLLIMAGPAMLRGQIGRESGRERVGQNV